MLSDLIDWVLEIVAGGVDAMLGSDRRKTRRWRLRYFILGIAIFGGILILALWIFDDA